MCPQLITVSLLTVRCGEWDTQTEDEKYPFQERKVNRIVVGRQRKSFAVGLTVI